MPTDELSDEALDAVAGGFNPVSRVPISLDVEAPVLWENTFFPNPKDMA